MDERLRCFKRCVSRCREIWVQCRGHRFNSFMVLGLCWDHKKETWSRSPKSCVVVSSSSTLIFPWLLPSSTGFCSSFCKKKVVLTIFTHFFFTAVLLYALTIRRTRICELFNFSPLKKMCQVWRGQLLGGTLEKDWLLRSNTYETPRTELWQDKLMHWAHSSFTQAKKKRIRHQAHLLIYVRPPAVLQKSIEKAKWCQALEHKL